MSEAVLTRGVSLLGRVPGVAFVLVALFAIFASMSPGFSTAPNLSNILVQSAILLLLALPMTFIIMTEGLDLSIGAVLTLSSVVLALWRWRPVRWRLPFSRRWPLGSPSAC